jgi:hypothetical protein
MNSNPGPRWPLNRRQFFTQSTAAGLFGLAISTPGQAAEKRGNPFAYDVSRLARTDPKLVHYEQVARITSPRKDPKRIAIGPDDNLYVAAGNYISVLNGQGVPLRHIALGGMARCLAVHRDGELFAGLRDHVELYDNQGERRATWESPGARTWLTGITATGSDVFLADAGNRIVLRCNPEGKILARIGAKDKDRGVPGFIIPSPFFDLEMHRDGLLRVGNPGRHRVEAYTPDGDLEVVWGRPTNQIDGFCGCCNPINLALFPDGRIVTCEKGLPRVKVYQPDGTLESVVAGPESFPANAKATAGVRLADGTPPGGLDAAVDSKGRIYILDLVQGDILVMARKTTVPAPNAPQPQAVPPA